VHRRCTGHFRSIRQSPLFSPWVLGLAPAVQVGAVWLSSPLKAGQDVFLPGHQIVSLVFLLTVDPEPLKPARARVIDRFESEVTGLLTSFSSTGIAKAGITYTGVISTIYADNLRNTDGTAGVRADGSVYGATAGFTGTTTVGGLALSVNQVAGGACTAGNFARDVNGRWLECVGNLWRLTGLGSAAIGSACSEGPFAINSGNANDSLICRGGVYVSLNTAIGLVSIIDSIAVVNGSVVAAPTCAAGTTAGLMTDLTRIQTPAGGGATRISYSGSGPWTISITGAGGEEAEVWRVCRYSGF
jgi:hypothetical protein